jgi:hypothetical protein
MLYIVHADTAPACRAHDPTFGNFFYPVFFFLHIHYLKLKKIRLLHARIRQPQNICLLPRPHLEIRGSATVLYNRSRCIYYYIYHFYADGCC